MGFKERLMESTISANHTAHSASGQAINATRYAETREDHDKASALHKVAAEGAGGDNHLTEYHHRAAQAHNQSALTHLMNDNAMHGAASQAHLRAAHYLIKNGVGSTAVHTQAHIGHAIKHAGATDRDQ